MRNRPPSRVQARNAIDAKTIRWHESVANAKTREASRVITRARMRELGLRIRTPEYPGRELDIAELDRLFLLLSAASWA